MEKPATAFTIQSANAYDISLLLLVKLKCYMQLIFPSIYYEIFIAKLPNNSDSKHGLKLISGKI